MGLSILNHPAMGYPPFGETPISGLAACALMIVLRFQLGTSLSTLLEPPAFGNMRKQSASVPLGTNEITWLEMGGAFFILKSESQILTFDGPSIPISIRLDLDLPSWGQSCCQWGVMIFYEGKLRHWAVSFFWGGFLLSSVPMLRHVNAFGVLVHSHSV